MRNLEQKNKIAEINYFLDELDNNNTLEIREARNSRPENITKKICPLQRTRRKSWKKNKQVHSRWQNR